MVQFLTRFDLGRSLGLSAFLALMVATGCWMQHGPFTSVLTLPSLVGSSHCPVLLPCCS